MKFAGKELVGILFFAAVIQCALSSTLRGHDTPKGQEKRSLLDTIGDAPSEYLVTIGNCEESEFQELIQDLGGDLLLYHKATSIAVVLGLSESAMSEAEASDCVASIDMSENIPFGDPSDVVIQAESMDMNDEAVRGADNPGSAEFYDLQWNMEVIQADKAWEAGRLGSEDVTIAILDSGVDYTHPDLIGRIDLDRSASFVPSDDLLVDYYFPGKHHITDLHFHGTHVAATASSNAHVAAGVTSKTTLIGIKVCNVVELSCSSGSVIAGLLHAVDVGADVANLSLGGAFLKNASPGLTGFYNRVFNYANRKKMTIVVAAGNDGNNLDRNGVWFDLHCDEQNTICVSATGPTDAPAPYTNYGTSVIDVAAPGGTSEGSIWAACSQTSLVLPFCQTGNYIIGISGTSMASPHVAGLAALVIEDVGRNPGLVKNIIGNTADDLGKQGKDPYYGKGRINVANAVL